MVEVYSEKPVMSVLGLFKAGIGAVLLVGACVKLVRGTGQGQPVWLLLGLAALLIGAGVYDLRKVADRRPQVRLWAEGFSALELGEEVVPWDAVASVEYLPGGGTTAMVRFHLRPEAEVPMAFNMLALGGRFQWAEGGSRFVQVGVSPLRDGAQMIFDAVARYAPGVRVINWR